MVDKLEEQTRYHLEVALFDWFIKNQIPFYASPPSPGIVITVSTSTSIKDAEYDFYKQLNDNGIQTNLYKYESDSNLYRLAIQWTIETILSRPSSPSEVDYHYLNNKVGLYNINHPFVTNLFAWLHVLYFCEEARTAGFHLAWVNAFKPLKLTLPLTTPKFALILSGHTREYASHFQSHRKFIENPYIDVFIHTWQHKGPRYEYIEEHADVTALTNAYKPTKILVEDEEPMKNTFSLRGRLAPIFLIWGPQQGDDATRYVNSKLYSTWKAFKLVEQYEQETGMTYDGIIKMNFNMDVTSFDFVNIIKDVRPTFFNVIKKALYVPPRHYRDDYYLHGHPHTGGGCSRCELESKYVHFTYTPNHSYHFDDVSEHWFYGIRDTAKHACELYLNAEQIMNQYHANNVANYVHVPHKKYRDFVYIQAPSMYQGKVYDIDNQARGVVCFYPERLMREHMVNYPCLSSTAIDCSFTFFDTITKKI
jgi:hypothetical protein